MMNFFATHAPGLFHWLTLSIILFSIGIYGLLTRRNAIAVLMSIELLLNASALNFILFNQISARGSVDGQLFAIFIIAVATAEVVIGIAIFMALFRKRGTLDVTRVNAMKD